MSHISARPKRAAEDYARTHHEDDFGSQPSKKPRFDVRNPSALAPDALEDDETLEADVIGKRGQQVRRGAVNVDGFDSDSDNDNFNERADARAKAQDATSKSKEEEDNDMFADLEEDFKDGDDSEGDADRKSGKKKGVRFLDADEIEGQVKNSKSGGHVSADFTLNGQGKGKRKATDNQAESSSESEVDDETRAAVGNVDEELGAGSKKMHAPKLDAFNMSTENEEGRFDDQGNYVRKAVDPDAVHDMWMDGISKKDMRKAKEAHEKREEDRRKRDLEDDSVSLADIISRLLPLLDSGETVLEALARLGKGKERKPKWQTKRKQQRSNGTKGDLQMAEDDPEESRRRQAIDAITSAADMLLTRGQTEVYDAEKELLMRQYKRETGKDWTESVSGATGMNEADLPMKHWEYRWSDARDGGQIHGPYDGATMHVWNDAGYFGEGVEFRQTKGDDTWSRVVDFI